MKRFIGFSIVMLSILAVTTAYPKDWKNLIYHPAKTKPTDSELKVKVGEPAPDFTLKALDGTPVSLSDYKGKKNVVISFVPSAWTPVCSTQWPGYKIAEKAFTAHDAALIGITVDNVPTLYAWTKEMGGLWFPVLSDFYPHGKVAEQFGVLRSDGTSERALFVIDKQGIIRYIDVHDIHDLPKLDDVINALKEIESK
ncbi:MAG: peroxiredoxin [Candidatus Auribacterota bacterium]